jgi:hypothetical protein
MCVKLDLSRHIEHDQVVVGNFFERVGQEVEVLHQELEAVYQAAVGAKAHFFHDIFEADQVFNVEVRLKCEVFGGGVEVYVETWALVVLKVLDEAGAEGGFAGTGWALLCISMLGFPPIPDPILTITSVPNLLMVTVTVM